MAVLALARTHRCGRPQPGLEAAELWRQPQVAQQATGGGPIAVRFGAGAPGGLHGGGELEVEDLGGGEVGERVVHTRQRQQVRPPEGGSALGHLVQ